MSINYEDIVDSMKKLRKEGWLPSEPDGTREKVKIYGELFNPSKRYQITIGILDFGTTDARVIPINEFNHEDWECPKCHHCIQEIVIFKNKEVVCQHCGLKLWREMNIGIS